MPDDWCAFNDEIEDLISSEGPGMTLEDAINKIIILEEDIVDKNIRMLWYMEKHRFIREKNERLEKKLKLVKDKVDNYLKNSKMDEANQLILFLQEVLR